MNMTSNNANRLTKRIRNARVACIPRTCVFVFACLIVSITQAASDITSHSLLNWSDWETYRSTVSHPALGTKPADIERARKNIRRHEWARTHAAKVEANVLKYADKLTSEFLVRMVPDTTPLSALFTPCPACREKGKPYQLHGTWTWNPAQSEQLHCTTCQTVYPNEEYPETVQLRSAYAPDQTFSYYGGDTFPIFQWKNGRPSFTGNIRSRKVEFMSKLARQFADAYALTSNPDYAIASRKILLRLSEVYPRYLVHCAYGEVADLSPKDAALSMDRLPFPELTYPPNKPNRTLFTKFWTTGRASGTGMEGTQLRQWTEAYDLTCDATTTGGAGESGRGRLGEPSLPEAVYSPEERIQIERDLLLEATILAVADPLMNNKSIGNRSAVGLVGACLGHPGMVRYGLEAFREMVDDYFLPDGGTPESISYGFMATTSVRDLSLAFRQYSDPPGYRDGDNNRHDNLDIFRAGNYPRIWQAFLDCLLPDLTFPPFADSHQTARFPPTDAEILASVYPDEPQYATLLAHLSGKNGVPADPATAIYLRSPDFDTTAPPPLTFPDHCRPDLRIGFMRGGEGGRESLLLLSATPWGVHRHQDSLNLYYWKNGHELLTDLGYLWDHADEKMTYRTFAHNLVMIDGKDQETRNRGGDVEFFHAGDHVKAMRASSRAYPGAKTYRRSSALIDHGDGNSYAVDLFEVQGGQTQDYVYHGPNTSQTITGLEVTPHDQPIYDLTDVRTGETTSAWTMQWQLGKAMQFTAWNVPCPGERTFVGSGWGQRDSKNRDRGTVIPYIIRRTEGDRLQQFVSVFEGSHPDSPFVKGVKRVPAGDADLTNQSVILEIETTAGKDYIAWNANAASTLPDKSSLPSSPFSVTSTQAGNVSWIESVHLKP